MSREEVAAGEASAEKGSALSLVGMLLRYA